MGTKKCMRRQSVVQLKSFTIIYAILRLQAHFVYVRTLTLH